MFNDYQKRHFENFLLKAVMRLYVRSKKRDFPFSYNQLEDSYCEVSGKISFPDNCEEFIEEWIRNNEGDNNLLVLDDHADKLLFDHDEGRWYINEEALPDGVKQARLNKTMLASQPRKKHRGGIVRSRNYVYRS